MVELYVLLTLAGIGYLLSKNSTNMETTSTLVHKGDVPSMNTLYDSSYTQAVNKQEFQAVHEAFQKSQKPVSSRVVGRNFRDNIQTVQSQLTGLEMPIEEFTHNNQGINNMVPYFGSRVTQNIDNERSRVNTFTGQFDSDMYVKKRERRPMFDPFQKHLGNDVFGNTDKTDELKSRVVPPRIRNNERPFQPTYVGPGLGQGFDSSPSGGYQQQDTLDLIRPKNVDELRVKTDVQKESFGGRIVAGQKPQSTPDVSAIGQVNKNLPDTAFDMGHDRLFTTVGAFTKETERPEYEVKETERTTTTTEYHGDAGPAGFPGAVPLPGAVKESSRQQFEKTFQGNLTSLVNAIIAPLEDIFKNSKKELLIDNPREMGHLQATFPPRITVKDPNDIARTTIKETNIHDTRETAGNIVGPRKLLVYDPNEVAKTTGRETLRNVYTGGNLGGGALRGQTYPIDKAATTVRETTIDNGRYGIVEAKGNARGGYESTEYDAKTTQKQFLSDNAHYGVAEAVNEFKSKSYVDVYNMTLNESKEVILEGRAPTKESVKMASGREVVDIQHKKLAVDEASERQISNPDLITNEPPSVINVTLTKEKHPLQIEDSIDINLLAQLEDNPYALPAFSQQQTHA